ncbi:MAG: hypothetical protein JWR63_1375 [Conexibacter sp.]|nr:hypothetical protein [Conexibacter sp.]
MRAALRKPFATPLVAGTLYLLLVPTFAFIYYAALDRGSFHDTNMQYERSLLTDRAALAAELSNDLPKVKGHKYRDAVGTMLELRQDAIEDVEVIGSSIRIRVDGFATGGSGFEVFNQYMLLGGAGFSAPQLSTTGPGEQLPVTAYDGPETLRNQSQVPASALFPHGMFDLPFNVIGELYEFYDASLGDPSAAGEPYWRYLYLSAVTITTLGFGDITPITTTARLLVGLEAVLGVVLIGLFLNGVAQRSRRQLRRA